MKICSGPFTTKHQVNALARIFKALILVQIKWHQLKRAYVAMIHLEYYLERLDCNFKNNFKVI